MKYRDKIHWKNTLYLAIMFVATILFLPLLILSIAVSFLIWIAPQPFEKFFYARSKYYKKLGTKYRYGIMRDIRVKTFNKIEKGKIKAEFIKQSDEFEYLVKGNMLIFFQWFKEARYDKKDGKWYLYDVHLDGVLPGRIELSKAVSHELERVDCELHRTFEVRFLPNIPSLGETKKEVYVSLSELKQ